MQDSRPRESLSRAPSRPLARSMSSSSESAFHPRPSPMKLPPPATPAPAYVAADVASEAATERRRFSLMSENASDDGSDLPDQVKDSDFSDTALALINGFLDYLLFNILAAARSPQKSAYPPAVDRVLKGKLAQQANAAGDAELQDLLGDTEDEEDEEPDTESNSTSTDRQWDQDLMWKRVRLRVMVYTSFGALEDEDEKHYVEAEKLYGQSGIDRRWSRGTGIISWAAVIFITAALEHIANECIAAAGQNAYERLRKEGSRMSRVTDTTIIDDADFVTIEERDAERIALSPALGRIWRQWRKSSRQPSWVFPSSTTSSPRASKAPRLKVLTQHAPRSDRSSGEHVYPSNVSTEPQSAATNRSLSQYSDNVLLGAEDVMSTEPEGVRSAADTRSRSSAADFRRSDGVTVPIPGSPLTSHPVRHRHVKSEPGSATMARPLLTETRRSGGPPSLPETRAEVEAAWSAERANSVPAIIGTNGILRPDDVHTASTQATSRSHEVRKPLISPARSGFKSSSPKTTSFQGQPHLKSPSVDVFPTKSIPPIREMRAQQMRSIDNSQHTGARSGQHTSSESATPKQTPPESRAGSAASNSPRQEQAAENALVATQLQQLSPPQTPQIEHEAHSDCDATVEPATKNLEKHTGPIAPEQPGAVTPQDSRPHTVESQDSEPKVVLDEAVGTVSETPSLKEEVVQAAQPATNSLDKTEAVQPGNHEDRPAEHETAEATVEAGHAAPEHSVVNEILVAQEADATRDAKPRSTPGVLETQPAASDLTQNVTLASESVLDLPDEQPSSHEQHASTPVDKVRDDTLEAQPDRGMEEHPAMPEASVPELAEGKQTNNVFHETEASETEDEEFVPNQNQAFYNHPNQAVDNEPSLVQADPEQISVSQPVQRDFSLQQRPPTIMTGHQDLFIPSAPLDKIPESPRGEISPHEAEAEAAEKLPESAVQALPAVNPGVSANVQTTMEPSVDEEQQLQRRPSSPLLNSITFGNDQRASVQRLANGPLNHTKALDSGSWSQRSSSVASEFIRKLSEPRERNSSSRQNSLSQIDTSQREFNELVSGEETVRYTLTPQNLRQIEGGPGSPYTNGHFPEHQHVQHDGDGLLYTDADGEPSTWMRDAVIHFEDPASASPSAPSTLSGITERRKVIPRMPQHLRERLLQENTKPTKHGFIREARIHTDTTRDLADYIRSTGPNPNKAEEPPKPFILSTGSMTANSLRSLPGSKSAAMSARTSGEHGSSSSFAPRNPATGSAYASTNTSPKAKRLHLEPREPRIRTKRTTDDLIEFLRDGPSVASIAKAASSDALSPRRPTRSFTTDTPSFTDEKRSTSQNPASVVPLQASALSKQAAATVPKSSRLPSNSTKPSGTGPRIHMKTGRPIRDAYELPSDDEDDEEIHGNIHTAAPTEQSLSDFLQSMPASIPTLTDPADGGNQNGNGVRSDARPPSLPSPSGLGSGRVGGQGWSKVIRGF